MTKEELIQELNESAEEIEELEGSYGYMFDAIADMVKDSDLVEVVRCKDCINWFQEREDESGWCGMNDDYTPPGWFCADGERKNEINND